MAGLEFVRFHTAILSSLTPDILPKVWVETVNGIIPGNGYHIGDRGRRGWGKR